jgi:DNA-binding transcriptional ArsR family regulator
MVLCKIEEALTQRGANNRIRIMRLLSNRAMTAIEISRELKLNYTTVRYHLDILERLKLVSRERGSRVKFYKLTKNGEILLSGLGEARENLKAFESIWGNRN